MNNQSPIISILMPVKNGEAHLDACLKSIVNQDFKRWELIVIDDHSDDKTADILQAFANKNPQIKPYKNTGRGIICALRMALKKSRAEMITRMDADDIMSIDRLSLCHQELSKSGKGHIVIGQVKYFSDTELSEGYIKYEKWLNNLTSNSTNYSQIYKECVIPSPNWLVYKSDLIKVGAFENDRYPEDYDLAFRFYQHKLKVKGIRKTTLLWRDHPGRSSRNDPNYLDNRFLELKMHYFITLEHLSYKTLNLIGAGKKAKWIAQYLIKKGLHFYWYTNNPKKIGKDIYGIKLLDEEHFFKKHDSQAIITIANPQEQEEIIERLTQADMKEHQDYYLFC